MNSEHTIQKLHEKYLKTGKPIIVRKGHLVGYGELYP